MTHAAESTHFYDRLGNPAYSVLSKKGTPRPTNVGDARKLNLVPSVTGIINCADKPGLNIWKIDQGILAALTLPRRADESEAQWLVRVKQDAREQAYRAAERGTRIHAAIQSHYEGVPPDADDWLHVKGAVAAVNAKFPGREWTAERSFCHPSGYGGKTDLSCADVIVDFKSKEFSPGDKMETFDEHHMQLSAYANGLGLVSPQAAIVYVSASNPGTAVVVEVTIDDLRRGWVSFCALLAFWRSKNRYSP